MVGTRALLVSRVLGVHISWQRKQGLRSHMRASAPERNRGVSPEDRKFGCLEAEEMCALPWSQMMGKEY